MKNSAPTETFEDFDFDFGLDAAPTPEAPTLPESFEEGTKEEISEVLAAFRQRAKEEEAAKKKNVSTDFWFAVYFASQDQRDAFLRAVDLIKSMDDQYIDGMTFAKALGIEIPQEEINIPKSFRRPADIDDLVMDI